MMILLSESLSVSQWEASYRKHSVSVQEVADKEAELGNAYEVSAAGPERFCSNGASNLRDFSLVCGSKSVAN